MSMLNEETLDVLDFLIQVTQESETFAFSQPEYDAMLARAVLLRNYHQALRNIEECRPNPEFDAPIPELGLA